MVVQFENALEMQQAARRGTDQGRRGEWVGRAKQLKIRIEMQERRAQAFQTSAESFKKKSLSEADKKLLDELVASCSALQQSIERERSELTKILQNLAQNKPKIKIKMTDFIQQKVKAAFAKYDANADGQLSLEEAREFIVERCKFEFGKDPSESEILTTFK